MRFAHLHVHTEYSRDGIGSINEYVQRASELGQEAFAVTDHGHLFALSEMMSERYKIIPGCEVYVYDPNEEKRHQASHLTLLALDESALRSLLYVLCKSVENFYYVPRVTEEDLHTLAQSNIVCLSGCIAGYCAKPYLSKSSTDGERIARARIKRLSRLFKDRFFLELQTSPVYEQVEWNKFLVGLNFPPSRYVVTSDVHYPSKKEYWAHIVVVGGRGHETEPRFDAARALYMQSAREVYWALRDQGISAKYARTAVNNTAMIADSCNIRYELNRWQVPSVPFADHHLRLRVEQALRSGRYSYEYWERAEEELKIISAKGFSAFFLLVHDMISYARRKGYYVNNRGSAVGSLVLYLLGVTSLDPVKYGIPYWRFISMTRDQPPDIDFDFERRYRDDVFEYVRKTYGPEHVAGLANIGRYHGKLMYADIRRAARRGWLPVSESEIDAWTPRASKFVRRIERALLNKARFISVHAGGFVISGRPLWHFTHYYKSQNKLVAALDKYMAERMQLMKVDALVVDTLDILRKSVGDKVDIFSLEPNDKKVYAWLNNNFHRLYGVFQLGTDIGMNISKVVRPKDFDGLMMAISISRPGAATDSIEKWAKKKVRRILKRTNGALIYQEQQMQLLKAAGFDDREVERIIKLNKHPSNAEKYAEEYEQYRQKWLKYSVELGLVSDPEVFWPYLTSYGFNMAHAASYAYLCYLTLWAKTYYYLDYMLACLNYEKNEKKQRQIISELLATGYKFKPPHVNHSDVVHTLQNGAIRLSLTSIHGVGEKAARLIVRHKPFDETSWNRFVQKYKRILNSRVVSLLKSNGALDGVVGGF